MSPRNGLPGEHHFYLTFRTDHPGAVIPPRLRSQYPAGDDDRSAAPVLEFAGRSGSRARSPSGSRSGACRPHSRSRSMPWSASPTRMCGTGCAFRPVGPMQAEEASGGIRSEAAGGAGTAAGTTRAAAQCPAGRQPGRLPSPRSLQRRDLTGPRASSRAQGTHDERPDDAAVRLRSTPRCSRSGRTRPSGGSWISRASRTTICDGRTVLRIKPEALSELAFQAFRDVSHLLRPAHLAISAQHPR